MMNLRYLTLSLAVASAFSVPAQAQSLVELYDAARGFDASYQSAKSQYEASLYRAEQAKAGLLPTAGLSLGANRSNIGSDVPSIEKTFGSQSATVSASQPQ